MELDEALRELKRELEALYGDRLKGLYLFGSHARGEAGPDSDVDVAVVLDDYEFASRELRRMADILNRLSLEYDVILAAVPVRQREWEDRRTPLLINLHREGMPVA
ncbi:MAG: nucleotidyltransferase domain-containing protein [Armatimonadota bacterium]